MNSVGDMRRPDVEAEGRQRTERQLGKLVHFEKRVVRPEAGKSPGSTNAEILIFTGVRYERDTPVTPTKPSSSPGTKRKRG